MDQVLNGNEKSIFVKEPWEEPMMTTYIQTSFITTSSNSFVDDDNELIPSMK